MPLYSLEGCRLPPRRSGIFFEMHCWPRKHETRKRKSSAVRSMAWHSQSMYFTSLVHADDFYSFRDHVQY